MPYCVVHSNRKVQNRDSSVRKGRFYCPNCIDRMKRISQIVKNTGKEVLAPRLP